MKTKVTTWEEYIEKTEAGEINSHTLEVHDTHWDVSGHDDSDQCYAAETPLTGASASAEQQLRDYVGDDQITIWPYGR